MAKQVLGRGLSALLTNDVKDVNSASDRGAADIIGKIAEIEIESIEVNPFQPRTAFDEDKIAELSQSIKELGLVQPITVRKVGFNKFQIISGERRLRASKLAGLKFIPAYIRLADDQDMLALALIENIQRQDLDPIEVAISYRNLIEQCSLTQEQLSEKMGKKRSTISNYLRLLNLDPIVQLGMRDGLITMGHGRALINIDNQDTQLSIYQHIIAENLSVRQAEELAKNYQEGKTQTVKQIKDKTIKTEISKEASLLAKEIQNCLGLKKIELKLDDKGKGKLSIAIASVKELERILELISKR